MRVLCVCVCVCVRVFAGGRAERYYAQNRINRLIGRTELQYHSLISTSLSLKLLGRGGWRSGVWLAALV